MNQKIPHVISSLLVSVLLTGQAAAQEVNRDQSYRQTVVELSSALGGAHAMRVTCNGQDDQYWRRYMQQLLSLEAPYSGSLRSAMVGAFNSTYSMETGRRGSCDRATVQAEKDYASNGQQLSEKLANRNIPLQSSSDLQGN